MRELQRHKTYELEYEDLGKDNRYDFQRRDICNKNLVSLCPGSQQW